MLRLETKEFWIDPAVATVLHNAGWSNFEALMESDLGREVKIKDELSVRLVEIVDPNTSVERTWFLKRSQHAPNLPKWRQLARAVRRREMPHCEAYHVSLVAAELGSRGFPVMPVVAAGETRLWGIWPLKAFVLAEAVRGIDASLVYLSGTKAQRLGLMSAFGTLMGRLHTEGYFFTLRLHDTFCQFVDVDGSPGAMQDARLTLIDLDFKGRAARAGPSTIAGRSLALAKTCHESLRSGLRLDVAALTAWWRAYRRSLPVTIRRDFLRQVQTETCHLTAIHHADAKKAAGFPDALAPDHPSLYPRRGDRARVDRPRR